MPDTRPCLPIYVFIARLAVTPFIPFDSSLVLCWRWVPFCSSRPSPPAPLPRHSPTCFTLSLVPRLPLKPLAPSQARLHLCCPLQDIMSFIHYSATANPGLQRLNRNLPFLQDGMGVPCSRGGRAPHPSAQTRMQITLLRSPAARVIPEALMTS